MKTNKFNEIRIKNSMKSLMPNDLLHIRGGDEKDNDGADQHDPDLD